MASAPGNGLFPLFEAIVNSIHAIEDSGLDSNGGSIKVEILRDTQQLALPLGSKKSPRYDITGFRVIDNGIGFTESNMKSFKTLDSDQKAGTAHTWHPGMGCSRFLRP